MAQGSTLKRSKGEKRPATVKKARTSGTRKDAGISKKKKHGKGAITKKGHFEVTQKKRVPPHAKEDKV